MSSRLASLDQFRGYTVAGMFLVNFLGPFAVTPLVLEHHNTYCSYADTIMPHFFFAVGFALRLVQERRVRELGARGAVLRTARRALWLVLLGVVLYVLGDPGFWKGEVALRRILGGTLFQTLVHIAVTTVWVLPAIRARPVWLGVFAVACATLHLALSRAFYLRWALEFRVIDGGPLGFLTWTIPTLAGAWACAVIQERGPRGSLGRLVASGLGLMVVGFALSGLSGWSLPFRHRGGPIELWTMSQRTGSVTYLAFSAGLSLVLYAGFVVACDLGKLEVGLFRTLGRNPLAGYVLHLVVENVVRHFVPREAPVWQVAAAFLVFFGTTWGILRILEWRGLYWRL